MIRVGNVSASFDRAAATIRGVRANLAGHLRARIHLDPRSDGQTNEAVLGYLLRTNPGLGAHLDAVARGAVSREWRGAQSTLTNMTFHAGLAIARELSLRLRSGAYVTNTAETTSRKARAGRSTTPGTETYQLAVALEHATVTVE